MEVAPESFLAKVSHTAGVSAWWASSQSSHSRWVANARVGTSAGLGMVAAYLILHWVAMLYHGDAPWNHDISTQAGIRHRERRAGHFGLAVLARRRWPWL